MLRIIFYLAIAMLDLIGDDKDKEVRGEVLQQEVTCVAMVSRAKDQSVCYSAEYRNP